MPCVAYECVKCVCLTLNAETCPGKVQWEKLLKWVGQNTVNRIASHACKMRETTSKACANHCTMSGGQLFIRKTSKKLSQKLNLVLLLPEPEGFNCCLITWPGALNQDNPMQATWAALGRIALHYQCSIQVVM